LIVLAVVIAAWVAIWFVTDSILEMLGWSVLPMLFALAYWWIREAQAKTRGYGNSGGDSAVGGEGGI
jgi:hypothetical protein